MTEPRKSEPLASAYGTADPNRAQLQPTDRYGNTAAGSPNGFIQDNGEWFWQMSSGTPDGADINRACDSTYPIKIQASAIDFAHNFPVGQEACPGSAAEDLVRPLLRVMENGVNSDHRKDRR